MMPVTAVLGLHHPLFGDVDMVMVDVEFPRVLPLTYRFGDVVGQADMAAPLAVASLQDIAAAPRGSLPGGLDSGDHLGGKVERSFAHRRFFGILRWAAKRARDGVHDVYVELAQAGRRHGRVRVLGHAQDENAHHLSDGEAPGFVRSPDFSLREGWRRPSVFVRHLLRSVRVSRAGLKGDGSAATGHPRKPNGAGEDMGEAE